MPDGALTTTHTLLAVLAVMGVVEAVVLGVSLALAVRWARRAAGTLREIHHELRPIVGRLDSTATAAAVTLAEIRGVTASVATGVRNADRVLRTVASVAVGARAVAGVGTMRAVGIAMGLRTAYRVFRRSGRRPSNGGTHPPASLRPVRHGTVPEVVHGR